MAPRTSDLVVFDDAGHDPTFASADSAYVMVVENEDEESTIGDYEEAGKVQSIYSISEMMRILEERDLLRLCEVDSRGE